MRGADGVFDYLLPFGYEREEERDARRDAGWPDDPDRPDPSEYAPDCFHLTKRLDCGHMVSASEDSGGMDELPRVTIADVERLLDFKVATHDCGRFVAAERIRVEGRPFG